MDAFERAVRSVLGWAWEDQKRGDYESARSYLLAAETLYRARGEGLLGPMVPSPPPRFAEST